MIDTTNNATAAEIEEVADMIMGITTQEKAEPGKDDADLDKIINQII